MSTWTHRVAKITYPNQNNYVEFALVEHFVIEGEDYWSIVSAHEETLDELMWLNERFTDALAKPILEVTDTGEAE